MKDIKSWAKRLLYIYQRAFWYLGVAKNEVNKPLVFWNEAVLLLAWLSLRYDFNPPFLKIAMVYIFLLMVGTILGKIFTIIGIVRYNTRIANDQNPQLMEILEKMNKLEDKVEKVINKRN